MVGDSAGTGSGWGRRAVGSWRLPPAESCVRVRLRGPGRQEVARDLNDDVKTKKSEQINTPYKLLPPSGNNCHQNGQKEMYLDVF